MDYSFYGGRPGFSFVIVMNYLSIDEMVACFKQGPDYEAVHFDEYVLINTENKNNPDNGKLFRRGYDYTNDMGGAIYIGNIVGPAGPAPMIEMTTIDEVVAKQELEGYEYRFSEGEYAPLYNLVPGRGDDGEFRDSIKWACCSVRNADNTDVTAWIGFIFPYLVVDYEGSSVNPYYNRDSNSDSFTNTNLIERIDDESHPYWEKWHISVPKGIAGDALKNFRVIVASKNDGVEPYDGQDDDRTNGRQILVYDYYHYDKNENGEPVTIYLGDYNMITDIKMAADCTITISYTHDDDQTIETNMKWIDHIDMDAQGTITVIYNDGSTETFTNVLYWIKDIYIKTADSSGEEGTGNQKLHVVYNTGEEEDIGEPLNYIMQMTRVDEDYHLLVWYSDPAKRQSIINEGKSYTYEGKDGWLDLGSVKDESGILIGTDISEEVVKNLFTDIDVAIEYLNGLYPNGLEGVNLQGKVITIGENTENKKFYAYDYDNNTWYYVGCLDFDVEEAFIIMRKDDPEYDDKVVGLATHGLWFVLEGDDD